MPCLHKIELTEIRVILIKFLFFVYAAHNECERARAARVFLAKLYNIMQTTIVNGVN